MAWTTPQFSRKRVDIAGEYLARGAFDQDAWSHSLDVVGNWRASHGWPLVALGRSLTDRATKVDEQALLAQRLKRLPTILEKLTRYGNMKLSQMQDVGGCRAVMSDVSLVEQLDRDFRQAAGRRERHQPECIERYDYIEKPKADGYRGIHLVYKYRTRLPKYAKHDGLRVEIQLRSPLQHAWATAVETVDLFAKQSLKSRMGQDAWKRFFALMAGVIARKERRPLPPGIPDAPEELRRQLRTLGEDLKVGTVLSAWSEVVTALPAENLSGAKALLLILDIQKGELRLQRYTLGQQQQASADYLEMEKGILAGSGIHAVLVSVRSLVELKQAYPGFYGDTAAFLSELREAVA